MAVGRLNAEQLKALAILAKQYPEVLKVFEDWRDRELLELPTALVNPALSQGRCQVLIELVKLVSEAPTHTG